MAKACRKSEIGDHDTPGTQRVRVAEAGRARINTTPKTFLSCQQTNLDRQSSADTQKGVAIKGSGGALRTHGAPHARSPVAATTFQLGHRNGVAAQGLCVVEGDGGAQSGDATLNEAAPVVAEIIYLWRMRQRWHRAEKALILQGRAFCRAMAGGDKDEANRLFDAALIGGDVEAAIVVGLTPFIAAIGSFAPLRAQTEKRLRKLARSLPVWPWVAEIKGFGDLNLAGIVGEAGDIAAYRNPSCLWKRMGLAVIDGGRQRKIADADEALIHGYSPKRRCVAYLLGETLIKAGDACRYRPVYAERRERTALTHPDWTPVHSHRDAMRVMTKRVLRDLWRAWRDEPGPDRDQQPHTPCPGSAADAQGHTTYATHIPLAAGIGGPSSVERAS